MKEKIQKFADKVHKETVQRINQEYPNFPEECLKHDSKVTIITGRKYTKVDVGNSGKYMVDQDGNIYGIKAYGVIHKGHCYGTLDTIDNYNWGGYTAHKIA